VGWVANQSQSINVELNYVTYTQKKKWPDFQIKER